MTEDRTTIAKEAAAQGYHVEHVHRLARQDPDFPEPIEVYGTVKVFRAGDLKRYWLDRRRAGITRAKRNK